jgi:tetratricopeptide (TPR) repeat protein
MAITLFSMANLAIMVGDLLEAIKNAADARDMFQKAGLPHDHCNELIHTLAVSMKKKGIAYEKKGKFEEAIDHYEACIPFADAKSQHAMQHEVKLLRKILHDRK